MLLSAIKEEFIFHCQCRNLSPKTINNYSKQIDYLLHYLLQEHQTKHIEDVEPKQIKSFLLERKRSGRTANYINDLLKACSISWFDTTFEENGITTVEEIELLLRVYDSDEWLAEDVFNGKIVLNP